MKNLIAVDSKRGYCRFNLNGFICLLPLEAKDWTLDRQIAAAEAYRADHD